MKILFIIEPFKVELLGMAYLASAIKKAGHQAEILKINDENFIESIKKINPDFLAYSVTTGKHKKFLEVHKQITHHFKIPSVWGGSHPTYCPEFINEEGVDTIIKGEAEKSFIDFLNNPRKGIIDVVPLEQDLDKIELPDREFLYKYSENRNNPIKNVITSRGCRFSCPYCFNSIYRGLYKGQQWVRHRSVNNVIEECIQLKKYPLEFIFFEDDEFLTNPNLEALLLAFKNKVKVNFHCQIRIELLTEKRTKLLKEAGCTGVTFAIESGNDKLRQELLSRKMSKEVIIKGSNLLHKYGITFRTENMIGLPNETIEQMIETLDLNIKCKPDLAWASIFQPYSKCPLGDYCKEQNLWDGEMEGFKETFFESTILKTPLKKQINNFQKIFSFVVDFPFLRPFIKILINVPNNKFYKWLYFYWKQQKYNKIFK